MSDSEDDFLEVFAKGGRRTGAAVAPKSVHASASVESDVTSAKLRPPERKIAAAQRNHTSTVNYLVRQNTLNRNLALGGIAAAEDAARDHEPGARSAVPQSSAILPSIPSAVLNKLTYDDAFNRALSSSKRANLPSASKLRNWNLAAGVALNALKDHGKGTAEWVDVTTSLIACLNGQAILYYAEGQTRKAIDFTERALSIAADIGPASSRSNDINLSVHSVMKRLKTMHASVGAVDSIRRVQIQLKEVEEALAATGLLNTHTLSTHAQDQDTVAEDQEKEEEEDEVQGKESEIDGGEGTFEEASAPGPVEAETAVGTSETPTPAGHVSVPPATLAAPQLPPVPELPVEDGTADSAFQRAMFQAMFNENFEGVTSLLNRALLGDAVASSALGMSLPVLGISLPMVCSGGDKPELLRRLLGALPPEQRVAHMIQARDCQGNNCIMHACAASRARALDELLRLLHASEPAYVPFQGDKASLSDVGVTLQAAQGYTQPVQTQLRSFLIDPAAYVSANVPHGRLAGPGVRPPRSAPPLTQQAMPQPLQPVNMTPALLSAQMAWLQRMFATMATNAIMEGAGRSALPTTQQPTTGSAGQGKAWGQGVGQKAAAPVPAAVRRQASASAPSSSSPYMGQSLGADLGAAAGSRSDTKRGKKKPLFDQFKANEELFGIKATFVAEDYTAELDESKLTPQQLAAATAMAEEIDRDAARRRREKEEQHEDEEGEFSAVSSRGRKGRGGGRR